MDHRVVKTFNFYHVECYRRSYHGRKFPEAAERIRFSQQKSLRSLKTSSQTTSKATEKNVVSGSRRPPKTHICYHKRELPKSRMIKTKRPTRHVNRVSIGQGIDCRHGQKSLADLVGILDAEILSELTDEDATLKLTKIAIRNRDYESFARIDPYIKIFWDLPAVVDGCIIIDDRNPILSCLQRAVLSRLHRSHP